MILQSQRQRAARLKAGALCQTKKKEWKAVRSAINADPRQTDKGEHAGQGIDPDVELGQIETY